MEQLLGTLRVKQIQNRSRNKDGDFRKVEISGQISVRPIEIFPEFTKTSGSLR